MTQASNSPWRWRSLNKGNFGKNVTLGPGLDFKLDAEGFFPAVMPPAAELRLQDLVKAGLKYERTSLDNDAIWDDKIASQRNNVAACEESVRRLNADLCSAEMILMAEQQRLKDILDARDRAKAAVKRARESTPAEGAPSA